jgi:peptidyl-prolyl cis-trans isomerase A (cyclophilin A)
MIGLFYNRKVRAVLAILGKLCGVSQPMTAVRCTPQEICMRRFCGLVLCTVLFWVSGWAQNKPTQTTPPNRGAAKPTGTHPSSNAEPVAIIDTTVGKMHCTLFPDKAPIGVANFIGLAEGTKDWTSPITHAKKHGVPLYDGTIFHRVIPGFMIQGGDPKGDGTGSPGYEFKNEVSPDLTFDRAGRLAYANSGPDTNGSQFFITEVGFTGQQAQILNGNYTIFGQCDAATIELVKQIARMARDPQDDRPFRPVKINHITIEKASGPASARRPVAHPASKPASSTANSTANH